MQRLILISKFTYMIYIIYILYNIILGMQRRMLGSSHEQLAATFDILATIFYNQNRFLEAQMLWTKAEAILVKKLGPTHPRCLQIQEDLKDVRQYLT
jgi:hypothetical protein